VKNKLEITWNKTATAYLRHDSSIYLHGLRNTTKIFNKDSRYLSQHSNQRLPK
jgi:hypothetical protein